jgi:crotonobetainyl-CoA:carnitine CoA-transferase CaiB-like acyl-CoA transferase
MTPIFKSRPRTEWCARLEGEGVPYAPVYDSSEALQDRQARHLEIEVEAEHPTMGRFRSVRFPVNFDGQRLSRITAPPTLGEHDAAIKSLAGQIWRSRSAKAAE